MGGSGIRSAFENLGFCFITMTKASEPSRNLAWPVDDGREWGCVSQRNNGGGDPFGGKLAREWGQRKAGQSLQPN